MSKLAVGSIEGLASEGYKITVPSGSKIIQTGAILQVSQVVKTDTFSTSSSSFTDITNISLAITPTSTTSKILVMASMSIGCQSNSGYLLLLRDGTAILRGDAASNRPRITATVQPTGQYEHTTISLCYLDSPSSTSSLTYKLQGRSNAGDVFYINRSAGDRDLAAYDGRSASTFTLMEIAG